MAGERILIVDDSPTNLKLIRVLLESEGYVASTASDADSALQELAQQLPDLILMDVQLPSVDGLTLTRLIKSESRTRNVGIVALTAYAMKGDMERALQAGCDGYLTKPIDTRTFGSEIARALKLRRERIA